MLPANVPMSVNNGQDGYGWDVNVGWFGVTGESADDAVGNVVSDLGSGISNVAAATAGDDFNVLNPYSEVSAYFITAALTNLGPPPSTSAPGVYRLAEVVVPGRAARPVGGPARRGCGGGGWAGTRRRPPPPPPPIARM